VLLGEEYFPFQCAWSSNFISTSSIDEILSNAKYNVDINEATLDGKGTFHATQVAACQRGLPKTNLLEGIKFSNTGTLHIPVAMNDIIQAPNRGTTEGPACIFVERSPRRHWFLRRSSYCECHVSRMGFDR
jgi:hypothetical protein